MNKQTVYLIAASLLMLVGLVQVAGAAEGDWYFTPGGASHHSSGQFNESNGGMGLVYEWSEYPGIKRYYAGGLYRNSEDGDTLYGAYGIKQTIIGGSEYYVDIGVEAAILTGYSDAPIIPAVLPTITIGAGSIAINVHYIPKTDMTPETTAVNLLIKLP